MSEKPSDSELAQLALGFLARVNLSGQEVPAFVAVNNWLQDHANGMKPEKLTSIKPPKSN